MQHLVVVVGMVVGVGGNQSADRSWRRCIRTLRRSSMRSRCEHSEPRLASDPTGGR